MKPAEADVKAYVVTRPCGCWAELGVIEPGRHRDFGKRAAKAARRGLAVRTVTLAEGRTWPSECEKCRRPEKAAGPREAADVAG